MLGGRRPKAHVAAQAGERVKGFAACVNRGKSVCGWVGGGGGVGQQRKKTAGLDSGGAGSHTNKEPSIVHFIDIFTYTRNY